MSATVMLRIRALRIRSVANCQVRAFAWSELCPAKTLEIREDPHLLRLDARVRGSHYAKNARPFSSILLKTSAGIPFATASLALQISSPENHSACPQARPGYSPRGPPPAVHTGSPAFLYPARVSADATSGRPPNRQISRAYSATVRSLEK
jgi:hypothetical protein